MARPAKDPVDRILDAWDAATPAQRLEAQRIIQRIAARGNGQTEAPEPAAKKRGRGRPRGAPVQPDPPQA